MLPYRYLLRAHRSSVSGFRRNEGNPSAGRNRYQRLHRIAAGIPGAFPFLRSLHRHRQPFQSPGPAAKPLRQLHQSRSLKTQRIKYRHRLLIGKVGEDGKGLFLHFSRALPDFFMGFLRLHIDTGNAGAGKNVVELMQKHLLPKSVRPGKLILHPLIHSQTAPHFHFPHSQLTETVVLLNHSLRGISPSVGAEIQLSHISVHRAALLLHIMEEFRGACHLHLDAALQILLALCVFHIIPCRAAASVSVAIGHQECIQILKLGTLLPNPVCLYGVCAVGVAGGKEGYDLRAVHPLPGKVMIRELLPFIVRPENLLGHQILYAAAL